MNRPGFRSPLRTGFTLVEMMASVAVLSLMLLAMGSAMQVVTAIWTSGTGTVDNFNKARTMLNGLDRDIQMMALRRDMAAFVDTNGNPACAFYANVEADESAPSVSSSTNDARTLSLVQYIQTTTSTSSVLQRLSYGANFSSTTNGPLMLGSSSLSVSATSTTNNTNLTQENLSTGVIAFQWQFVDGTGTVLTPPYIPTGTSSTQTTPFTYRWPNATSNPRAVIISLVVLSNSAYTLAVNSGKLSTVVADFPTTASNLATGQTYSAYWNSLINSSTLSALPAPIRAGAQVFQRTIPLPVITPSS